MSTARSVRFVVSLTVAAVLLAVVAFLAIPPLVNGRPDAVPRTVTPLSLIHI